MFEKIRENGMKREREDKNGHEKLCLAETKEAAK